jgi:ABC-type nickel/cobalt efflux system permease component RcnA
VIESEVAVLLLTAASLGFLHTLLGPDHYVPFAVMATARKWTLRRTISVTLLCGVGHIAGSVVLGIVGIAMGFGLASLEQIQSFRGTFAAWALVAFGLMYFAWGLRRAFRNQAHTHVHFHSKRKMHQHRHSHHGEHAHVHEVAGMAKLTPWALFVIFVLGPCEALIPLLMFPAAKHSFAEVLMVVLVFGAVTIVTMVGAVIATTKGLSFIPLDRFSRFNHALAGMGIGMCGLAIILFGV